MDLHCPPDGPDPKEFADWLMQEMQNRNLSGIAVVVYQNKNMPQAKGAYCVSSDVDFDAVALSVIDLLGIAGKDPIHKKP
jgi:hypothetical protein